MTRQEFISTLNKWGGNETPFLFIIDFEFDKPVALTLDQVNPQEILYDFNGFTNALRRRTDVPSIVEKHPVSRSEYQAMFEIVYRHLDRGDSYLTNLTSRTRIKLTHGLEDVFHSASAKYKLYLKDSLVVFSPESFIKIVDDFIYSYPMKGTIDASVPDATSRILDDVKEKAEHVTIVDLLRNDLSQVADNVEVMRFRYIDEIRTNEKTLLQVSSEIRGRVFPCYRRRFGDLLNCLMPAGSISGAPKPKTLDIISAAEKGKRGYYTGVFGYFNGVTLDSGVMIRYIENENGSLYYRSGGGLTTQSEMEKEYQEMIDKVYVPVT